MSVFRKILANVRPGKGREIEPEPIQDQPSSQHLRRANAKLQRKNQSKINLSSAKSDLNLRPAIPRNYSFDPAASVEHFNLELSSTSMQKQADQGPMCRFQGQEFLAIKPRLAINTASSPIPSRLGASISDLWSQSRNGIAGEVRSGGLSLPKANLNLGDSNSNDTEFFRMRYPSRDTVPSEPAMVTLERWNTVAMEEEELISSVGRVEAWRDSSPVEASDGSPADSACAFNRHKVEWRQELERQHERIREEQDRIKARELAAQLRMEQEEEDRIRAEELQEQWRLEEAEDDEEQRLAAERVRFRECLVCGDSKNALDFPVKPPTVNCDHRAETCSGCLEQWMTSEFDTKGLEGIKCPNCQSILDYIDFQTAASGETFEAYDKLATRTALGSSDEFAWCLAPDCGNGQFNIENDNYMDCVHCGYKQCLTHKVPWHSNETCEEYEYRTSGAKTREEERQTEAMIDSISKLCPGPNCGWRIQKIDGCEHMTCKRCKHEFCWQCLASHQEIRRVGNTAHEASCKFHSTNLEVTWPFNMH